MHNKRKLILGLGIGMLLIIAYLVFLYFQPGPQKISYNEFLQAVNEGRVKRIYLQDKDILNGLYMDGTEFITDNPRKEGFKEELLKKEYRSG